MKIFVMIFRVLDLLNHLMLEQEEELLSMFVKYFCLTQIITGVILQKQKLIDISLHPHPIPLFKSNFLSPT